MPRTSRSLLVVIVVACTTVACAGEATVVPMPTELIGRWETSQPAYADRFFELATSFIVIGTGGAARQRYTISEVSRMTDDEGLLYTVTYRDGAGEEYNMSFYFDDSGNGTLQLQHQLRLENQLHMVWRKVRR